MTTESGGEEPSPLPTAHRPGAAWAGPLSPVDDRFAWDEGEGDRTREWWLDAHHWFFRRQFAEHGLRFHPDKPVVFERFDVVYREP